MKICIIGAGITGLTTGYKLSKLGHEVEIFESASFSGGQASTINFENFEIEKAYHHLFVTDKAILGLGSLNILSSLDKISANTDLTLSISSS